MGEIWYGTMLVLTPMSKFADMVRQSVGVASAPVASKAGARARTTNDQES
jgi:hypothetical protein